MIGNGVTLNASGFPANVDVDLFWVELQAGGPIPTDANGELEWSGAFSEGLEPGTYTARLTHEDLTTTASFTVTEDPAPVYEPQISVTPSTMTVSEAASTGVTIVVTGFPANVEIGVGVPDQFGQVAQTDENGAVTLEDYFLGGPEEGPLTLSASYGDLSAQTIVTITADEDPDPVEEPTASANPSTLTRAQLLSPGVTFLGAGFPANVTVGFAVDGEGAGSGTTDAEGNVSLRLFTILDEGTYDVVLTSGDLSATTSFTVTANPAPVYEPEVSVNPSSVSEAELASSGVTVSGTDFPAGEVVTLTVAGESAGSETVDANRAVSFDYVSDSLGTGTHDVVLTSGDLTASASLTVTEDAADPVYNPGIGLSPSEVSESALADSGVTVTGNGFPESAAVSLYVGGDQVAVADSDSNGDIEFTYTSDALAPGEYTVRLEADADGASVELTLTVTADEIPVPVTIPAVEPGPEDLDPPLEGGIGVPASAAPGDTIVLTVDGVDPGTEVGVWIFSEAVYLGTHTVDANGQVTVTIPESIALGTHTISVWTQDGLLGWDTIVITSAADDDPVVTDPVTAPGAGGDGLAATGGTLSAAMLLTVGLLLAFGFALVFRARTRKSSIA